MRFSVSRGLNTVQHKLSCHSSKLYMRLHFSVILHAPVFEYDYFSSRGYSRDFDLIDFFVM